MELLLLFRKYRSITLNLNFLLNIQCIIHIKKNVAIFDEALIRAIKTMLHGPCTMIINYCSLFHLKKRVSRTFRLVNFCILKIKISWSISHRIIYFWNGVTIIHANFFVGRNFSHGKKFGLGTVFPSRFAPQATHANLELVITRVGLVSNPCGRFGDTAPLALITRGG